MFHMPHVEHRILFDPDPQDIAKFAHEFPAPLKAVRHWNEVETLLLPN
jgi:hypothetical protein